MVLGVFSFGAAGIAYQNFHTTVPAVPASANTDDRAGGLVVPGFRQISVALLEAPHCCQDHATFRVTLRLRRKRGTTFRCRPRLDCLCSSLVA